ncbi:hypothetical protein WJ06_10105 [Burkholderia cepacia]|nr:hypothetical protein WJ06_10105 [Burkholderia cepacia]
MARASKADLNAALDVSNVIEQLEKGWMPYADDSDKLERFDRDDANLCQRAIAAILDAASTGNLFRVTFGMTVVLDPRNELLDPAADTLELHPKLVAARDGAPPVTDAARDVLAERHRQLEAEGWTPEHDDQYQHGSIAQAAGCYALHASGVYKGMYPSVWPWMPKWWKPTTPRRDLVKAGALILAEIERLDRAILKGDKQ